MLQNIISNEIENYWLKKHYVIKTVIIKNVELKLSNETLVTGIENQLLCIAPRKTKSTVNERKHSDEILWILYHLTENDCGEFILFNLCLNTFTIINTYYCIICHWPSIILMKVKYSQIFSVFIEFGIKLIYQLNSFIGD